MSEIKFILDGEEVTATAGQTILEAADAVGVYIPRLCHLEGLIPHGGCRICTVELNGRPVAACTHPVGHGVIIETDNEALRAHRKLLRVRTQPRSAQPPGRPPAAAEGRNNPPQHNSTAPAEGTLKEPYRPAVPPRRPVGPG